MQGFYTPDLAMADVKIDDILIVKDKKYDPDKDMIWWEFEHCYKI